MKTGGAVAAQPAQAVVAKATAVKNTPAVDRQWHRQDHH